MRALWRERRGTALLLAAALCVMAYAYLAIQRVPDTFQRVTLAPQPEAASEQEEPTNRALRQRRQTEKEVTAALEGACERGTLYAVGQPAAVSAKERSASARLLGVQESWFGIRQPVLLAGRLIYPDELLDGERVCMLEEGLAVALFQYAAPLDEHVELDGQRYRVVGVVRGGKRVGDQMEYTLYVPYRALEKSAVALTSLVYEAKPVRGAGGWTMFQASVTALGEGTTVSLTRERMNAAMPLRLLGVVCGAALALYLLRRMNGAVRALAARWRVKLLEAYAARLMGWLIPRVALAALGYAACAALAAGAFMALVQPVYTFPEWVPAVLVEPKDIQTAFWNVWQTPARVMELRTPELLRLRFLRELMGWSAGAAGVLAGSLWGRGTAKGKETRGEG